MSLPSAELVIYKKAEMLLDFVYPIVVNFPKSEKFALSQEIKQAFYAVLRNIMLANNIRHKRRQYQEEVDAYLKLIPVLFNVAKKQKYITQTKNTQIQKSIAEIGRILGGWMKSNN
ncbi:diversity-generating retroelement protein Avd [Sporosarcina sp. FSL K6-5500]|uniref:diversity-generating retroelement protein Avd n=1 Tax=Sporosarcina sp. FSL K6-5500 TaxID=2921558 RepID=UPI0030F720C8